MNVKDCETLEKSQVRLTVEVSAEEFEAAVEKAFQRQRRKIRVQGFRPGKAPRKIVERMYGADVFYEEAVNDSVPDACNAAVAERELKMIAQPDIAVTEGPGPDGFTFTATFPVYPKVTLGQYKGLTAPKPEVEVTEEDVNAALKQLADRNTRLVSVDRAAQEGDTVVIDFEGFLDGQPFPGGHGENYSLELGSKRFVPGFEEQLVGAAAGEDRKLNIVFPDDYAAELAGKSAVFDVTVHEVKEKDVPEMDDEFAKDVSEFDTLQELREDLESKIRENRDREAQRLFEDALMDQVADGITADIPDVLIERQARQFVQNLKASVYQQGLTYDQYLQMTGTDEEKLLADAQEPAVQQVRMDLAVNALIEEEGLEADEEDLEAEYARLAAESGMDAESVKKYFTEEQAKDQVLTRKAIAVVADSATAVAAPPAEAGSEDSTEEADA